MKKQLVCCVAVLMFLVVASPCSFAESSVSPSLRIAIKKYRVGNYVGCLQDCQSIIQREPSNALAYYYVAISYAQAGKKDEAVKAYEKVLSLKPNQKLSGYATTGKRCLETPDKCVLEEAPSDYADIDKFLANPGQNVLSDTVKKDIENQNLDAIKNDINSGKEIDGYSLKKIDGYSNQKTEIETNDKIAQSSPNTDEIVAALKILKEAGINPQAQVQPQVDMSDETAATPYAKSANYQNPELTQLNMLMGGNNQQKDDTILNMLPFMIAQNKNGNNNYSPQMMQAVIMNSMMPDFNFDLNKDK